MDTTTISQVRLLQLCNSSLPVGAYSYSEGLETLVDQQAIASALDLENWLYQELTSGSIRIDAAIMLRAYRAVIAHDAAALRYWNQWWSAARETEELRLQSWQMGRSLLKLFLELQDHEAAQIQQWSGVTQLLEEPCNFAIAFGVVAMTWQIDEVSAVEGYLHSWTTNLINAGIKLIPLGQTAGQQILLNLGRFMRERGAVIITLEDDALESCNWGLSLASMAHEMQYSRLFRS
jgi:urease accessory protein